MILLPLPSQSKHFFWLYIFQTIAVVKQERFLWFAIWTLEPWKFRKTPSKLRAVKPFSSWKTPSIHLNKPFQKMQAALQSRLFCLEERGLHEGCISDLKIGQGTISLRPSQCRYSDLFLHFVFGISIKLDQYLASFLMSYHTLLKIFSVIHNGPCCYFNTNHCWILAR